MNNNISIFSHPEFGEIRTMIMPDGQIGFVGKDVAEVLGYSIPQKAIIEHVDFEDRTVLTYKAFSKTEKASLWRNNDFSNKVIINESGLYALILSSKLPKAREFKHCVTSEVLPQIRKTGGYIPVDKEDDDLRLTLCIDRHETRIDDETLTQVLEFDCSEACSTTEIWEEEGGILDPLQTSPGGGEGCKRVNQLNK